MKVSYTVLNIYRIYDSKSFIIALYNTSIEYFKVAKSMSESISKGMVFVGDKVTIKEITNDGIIFEVSCDSSENESSITQSEVDFFYSDNKKLLGDLQGNFLPFLCDVLPYSNETIKEEKAKPIFKNGSFIGKYLIDKKEISNIKVPLPQSFVAKVVQKTRINLYPTSYNPFFFAIISSNDIFIKAVFWKETLKSFSSLKVGDVLMIKDYKMKKKWNAVDKIEPNTFTESIYFDVDEITVKELIKIKYDKKTASHNLFETIQGNVLYLSLIMRVNMNGTLMEYVLMKVNGYNVVLFYNSDPEFYKIQPGTKLILNELRKIQRAGETLYISTIFTQFEIEDENNCDKEQIDDKDEAKRIKMDINDQFNEEFAECEKNIKDDSNIKKSTVEKSVFTKKEFDSEMHTKQTTKVEKTIHSTQEITKFSAKTNDTSISFSSSNNNEDSHEKMIFGAIGFIPDNFSKFSEAFEHQDKDIINGNEVSLSLFFKPTAVTIDEIKNQSLVLNEIKKFVVNTKIVEVADVECTISYFENNQTKTQGSFQLVLEKDFKIFVYENFFIQNTLDLRQFEISNKFTIIGKEVTLAIEGFRADENNVIYYLTGIIQN